MSHYTVAVITKTNPNKTYELEELLAPFDEGLEVEPYIGRTREEIIEAAKERKESWKKRIEEETSIDTLKEMLIAPKYQWARKYLSAETDEDFHNAEAYIEECDIDGNEWSTYNPNSKWDWYSIGGRWCDALRTLEGERGDCLRLKDWDYNYIDPSYVAHYSRYWEVAVEGADRTEEEKENNKFLFLYKPEYYIEKYGNKSNFIKSQLTFSTYALLTPDGEWLEPGKMGWWGISGADPKDEGDWEANFTNLIDFIKEKYGDECYVTLVDCHI